MYSWLLWWICLSLKQEIMCAKGLWTYIFISGHYTAELGEGHLQPLLLLLTMLLAVFGLRIVGCKQLVSYCFCNNVNLNLSLWWWILLPFSTRVNLSFSWNLLSYILSSEEILIQKNRMFFWSVWTLHTQSCCSGQGRHLWASPRVSWLGTWAWDAAPFPNHLGGGGLSSTAGVQYRIASCNTGAQNTQNPACFKWKDLFQLCTWCIHNWEKSWAQVYKWAGNGGILTRENGVIGYQWC